MLDLTDVAVDDNVLACNEIEVVDDDVLVDRGVVSDENLCVTAYFGEVVPSNIGLNTGLYDQVGVVDCLGFDVEADGFCNAMAVSMRNGGNVDDE